MNQSELLLLNFKEIRRRSVKLWSGLPESELHWRPDEKAMTAIEMIRHVLEADYGWNMIINNKSLTNYQSPWNNRPFLSVTHELEFATPYRDKFLESVRQLTDTEINKTEVIHPGNGKKKNLGQYLLRIGYHESIHAGQFLSYLRTMNVERPFIWD